MRIARVRDGEGLAWLARAEGDEFVPILPAQVRSGHDSLREALEDGIDFASIAPVTSSAGPFRLRSPLIAPQKVMAIGLNYRDHAVEANLDLPSVPVMFMKAPSALIGPGDEIWYRHADTAELDYEGELAVVIGRRVRDVPSERALRYVFGYLVCNDVSARDAQFSDGQFARAKSYDTFCPIGPWITTTDDISDPQDLAVRTRVNGVTVQDSSTKEMVFSVAAIVSYLSRFMTLEPGDIISTGTPAGVGFVRRPPLYLEHGDLVEVEIDQLGVLSNPVRRIV